MKLTAKNIIITMIIMMILVYLVIIHAQTPKGERPIFSDGYIKDGITSRWKSPVFYTDDLKNYCTLDVQDNIILIIDLNKKEPTFNLQTFSRKCFKVTFRPESFPDNSLQSKSVELAGKNNEVFFIKDSLDFTIYDLKPKTAESMKTAIENAMANGTRISDFAQYLQKFIEEKNILNMEKR